MGQTTAERQDEILAELYRNGRVQLKDLALRLEISEATVRRDLKALAEDGKLELVHGGAVLRRASDYSFQSKRMRNIESKRLIGQLASALVSDHDQIFLDSGTTCFQMASLLNSRRNLCVIANSARLVMELSGTDMNVILLGGQYRPERMDTVGPLVLQQMDNLRGFKAFIGADGLSMEFGLTANDIESASLYARAVAHSRETILLADHTKFLSPSLFKIVEFDRIARVVTDKAPSQEWRAFFEEKGIELILPD